MFNFLSFPIDSKSKLSYLMDLRNKNSNSYSPQRLISMLSSLWLASLAGVHLNQPEFYCLCFLNLWEMVLEPNVDCFSLGSVTAAALPRGVTALGALLCLWRAGGHPTTLGMSRRTHFHSPVMMLVSFCPVELYCPHKHISESANCSPRVRTETLALKMVLPLKSHCLRL